MRKINLTDKLALGANKPVITIGDVELEINNSAAAILSLAEILDDDHDTGVADMMRMEEILFEGDNQQKLHALNLSFGDYKTVLMAAVQLAADMEDNGSKN
jgi:hypothetical protein